MTQATLAELADLELRMVQRIETDSINPSFLSVVKIARALGVELRLLLRPAEHSRRPRGRPKRRLRNADDG